MMRQNGRETPGMRLGWVLGFVAFAACEPPPKIQGADVGLDPAIDILYPPIDQTCIPADDVDGMFRQLVVVDIDNLEFVPPGTSSEIVEAEGHWHIRESGGSNVRMPADAFVTVEADAARLGETVIYEAFLVDNLHVPLEGDEVFDVFEITLGCP